MKWGVKLPNAILTELFRYIYEIANLLIAKYDLKKITDYSFNTFLFNLYIESSFSCSSIRWLTSN